MMKSLFVIFAITLARVPSPQTRWYDVSDYSDIMNTFKVIEDEFENPTTYSKRFTPPFFMMMP